VAGKKFTILLSAIVFLILLIYFIKSENEQSVRYTGFGISIPGGYAMHGIDVSKYQKTIQWDEVAGMEDQGIKIAFAITKATEGTDYTDPHFRRNWDDMKRHHIQRGAYMYFHPSLDAKRQAIHFIQTVKQLSKGDLLPVVDIEESQQCAPLLVQKKLKECLSVLEEFYHQKPIIYTNPVFFEEMLNDSFPEYPLWIAHYTNNSKPGISTPWCIWQHHCTGHVNGIDALVDFNVVRDASSQLKITVP